jgi:hypothetical protein
MQEARQFTIFTDHKPIAYAFQQKRDKFSPRQFKYQAHFWASQNCRRRHISRRVRLCANIIRRTGRSTGRRRAPNTPGVNYRPTARETTDPGTVVSIHCYASAERSRPYVPGHLWLQGFQSVHELSHSSTKTSAKLVAQVLSGQACRRIAAPGHVLKSSARTAKSPTIQ